MVILTTTTLFAQIEDSTSLSGKEIAEHSIVQFKNGALLVRLPSKHDKILALRKAGNIDLANTIEHTQLEQNQKLANAFRKYFTFTKVYFFYKEDTEQILSGKTDGLLLNKKLMRDPNVTLDTDFFLIAEYGPADSKPDRFEQRGKEPIQDFENEDLNSNFLKIMDHQMQKLPKPFPAAIKANNINMADKQVTKLNKNLHEYYLRVTNG